MGTGTDFRKNAKRAFKNIQNKITLKNYEQKLKFLKRELVNSFAYLDLIPLVKDPLRVAMFKMLPLSNKPIN